MRKKEQSALSFYPNCAKIRTFRDFERGVHPSQLTKKYPFLKYRTLMLYYDEWKRRIENKREDAITEFNRRAAIMAKGHQGDDVHLSQIRKIVSLMDKRINMKPLEWFLDKTADDIVDIIIKEYKVELT